VKLVHHKGGTEKCLAYAFTKAFANHDWTVTNYAHYLSICPPKWEVQLKPVTAWSCSHGVDRWQDDCGCGGGGEWHQKWRKPLRESLNWLRDELITLYDQYAPTLLTDPWGARDEYVKVILERSPDNVEEFLTRHQCKPLSKTEKIDALRLLEMQRHSLLMFTSCGWFFEEISRPEGTQILRYAARAMELAAEVSGVQLEKEFRFKLALAPSNVESFKDGDKIYQDLVIPAHIGFEQVAAHYAISSLFTHYDTDAQVYCYKAQQLDYQKQQIGSLTLAVGQVKLISDITWEENHYIFGVLHIGGWDFHCCIQPYQGRSHYSQLKEQLFTALNQASVAKMIVTMSEVFGNHSFDLQNLFAEERHRIMQYVTNETKQRLDQLYTQVYRDNYGILAAFHRDELPVPQELQVAAEIAISHRCTLAIEGLEAQINDPQGMASQIAELQAISAEAKALNCQLTVPQGKPTLERLIYQGLFDLLANNEPETLVDKIEQIVQMIEVGKQLELGVSLEKVQEHYYNYLHQEIIPYCLDADDEAAAAACNWTSSQLCPLLGLGEILAVDVSPWL
jgi:alpha-amylase/alpha-mannosidase (GH57 family)